MEIQIEDMLEPFENTKYEKEIEKIIEVIHTFANKYAKKYR